MISLVHKNTAVGELSVSIYFEAHSMIYKRQMHYRQSLSRDPPYYCVEFNPMTDTRSYFEASLRLKFRTVLFETGLEEG